jgi:hypothetical protein
VRLRRWFVVVGAALAVASAADLALLCLRWGAIPAGIDTPLRAFAAMGVFVWWAAFGNLFTNTFPSSPAAIAFATFVNAAFWSLALWCLFAVVRLVRRMVGHRSR